MQPSKILVDMSIARIDQKSNSYGANRVIRTIITVPKNEKGKLPRTNWYAATYKTYENEDILKLRPVPTRSHCRSSDYKHYARLLIDNIMTTAVFYEKILGLEGTVDYHGNVDIIIPHSRRILI